jgi:glycosyltransferase involved in cell wall biosynthesis
MPDLTVIICAHNPHPGRLARTLDGLRAQTLPAARWDCVLVDNASAPPLAAPAAAPPNLRVVREPQPGLSHARRRGLRETTAPLCVFADDDNVLAPDYLAQAARLAAAYPSVGAFGGRSLPEFETPPPEWAQEFFDLLALRDLGPHQGIINPAETPPRHYPPCAPIGAGMVLRREAVQAWLDTPASNLTDRRGGELTSGGDNDIVLTLFTAGWDVAYFCDLVLTHLIPAARLDPAYLARLNRAIQKSWVQVLARHGLRPWQPIPAWTLPLRQLKAWLAHRAWSSPDAHIRWQGACGRFEGQAALDHP